MGSIGGPQAIRFLSVDRTVRHETVGQEETHERAFFAQARRRCGRRDT